MNFGSNLKRIIHEQGITQSHLAAKMGVTRQSVSSIIKQLKPHRKTIEAVASAVGVSIDDLMPIRPGVFFKENIERILQEKNISKVALAKNMGKSPQNVSTILKNDSPSLRTAREFADALCVPVGDLFLPNTSKHSLGVVSELKESALSQENRNFASKQEIGEAYILYKSAQTDTFEEWFEKYQTLNYNQT